MYISKGNTVLEAFYFVFLDNVKELRPVDINKSLDLSNLVSIFSYNTETKERSNSTLLSEPPQRSWKEQ